MVLAEEEVSADLLSILLPTVLGVAMVLVTVAIVFWLGTGSQRSYEAAKNEAKQKAEEALRDHVSPRAKKQRRSFRKKKSGETQEEPEPPPRKGILKSSSSTAAAAGGGPEVALPERPTPNKVGFKLDTPPKEEDKTPTTLPPTPYPGRDSAGGHTFQASGSKGSSSSSSSKPPLPQPVFEEPEPEVPAKSSTSHPAEQPQKSKPAPATKALETSSEPPQQRRKHQQSQGKTEPPAAKKEPVTTTTAQPKAEAAKKKDGGAPTSKRSKGGSKGKGASAVVDGPDMLPASRIVDIVGASILSDEDIQHLIDLLLEKSNANSEWEAANLKAESNKSLKRQNHELHGKLEEAQQAVLSHSNKIKELRKEVQAERTKHQSAEQAYQSKLAQQANELSIFKTRANGLELELKQVKALAEAQSLEKMREENSQLTTQLTHCKQQMATLSSQLQDAVEQNRMMAKEMTLKVSEGKLKEVVAEKESLLEHKGREIEQLNTTVQRSHTELLRLKKTLSEVGEDRDKLKQQVEQLESAQAQLLAQAQSAASSAQDQSLARVEALREEFEQSRDQEIARERAEMQAQHQEEVERLRKGAAEEAGRLRESLGGVEERNKQLLVQVETCSGLQQQVTSLSQQLDAEKTAAKELQGKVEDLQGKLEDLQSQGKPNGPVAMEEALSNGGGDGGEELSSAALLEAEKQVAVLERKLDELKNKNNELSESLWKAKDEAGVAEKDWERKLREAQDQVESKASSARAQALAEGYTGQKALLVQLFPGVTVEGCESKPQLWLERFEGKVQDIVSKREEEATSLKEKVGELEVQKDKDTQEIKQFRTTLETTMEILKKLQAEVDSSNSQHQQKLEEKEAAIEAERDTNRQLQEALRQERAAVGQVKHELEQEKAAASRALEASRAELEGVAGNQEEVSRLEGRLKEVEQGRKEMEEQVAHLNEVMKKKAENESKLESQLAAECKLKEEAISNADKLTQEKKDLSERLDTMKQSNRQLNARIASLAGPSPTDSEV